MDLKISEARERIERLKREEKDGQEMLRQEEAYQIKIKGEIDAISASTKEKFWNIGYINRLVVLIF